MILRRRVGTHAREQGASGHFVGHVSVLVNRRRAGRAEEHLKNPDSKSVAADNANCDDRPDENDDGEKDDHHMLPLRLAAMCLEKRRERVALSMRNMPEATAAFFALCQTTNIAEHLFAMVVLIAVSASRADAISL